MISGTNFRYQSHLAAFLCQSRPKEKLTKEKAETQGSSPRTLATFEKVDETTLGFAEILKARQNNRLVRCKQRARQ